MSVEPQDWLSNLESGSTIIRNLGLVMAAAIAMWFAKKRIVVADRQADAAQRQQATAQRGLLNERYQKGAEMLGNKGLSVRRLGGIYALQHLAEEYPEQYHIRVMRLFCAFVRNPREAEKEDQDTYELSEDVLVVMKAVRERSEAQIETEKKEEYRLGLSGANLFKVYLSDADLSDAYLIETNLNRAILSHADLTGANLSNADMRGCIGLTQEQVNRAVAQQDHPPDLTSAVDVDTGEPLVWRGETPNGRWKRS